MRSPLTVILAVAAILLMIVVGVIFAVRGNILGNASEPIAGATADPNANAGGLALPASQGMATFTPVPPSVEQPPSPIPTALPLPIETAVPAPQPETQAAAPTPDPQVPVIADPATNSGGVNNGDAGAPPIAVPPAGAIVESSSNANIQVTPVPAIPVNGGGASSGGGGSSGGSGSSGGGASCGTRLIHVVRPGENLFRIGLRYNTTAYAIARLNGITNVRLVSSGRRLVIVACARGGSGGGQYTPRSSTYVVKPGDTLFRIALRFGINTNYLCQVNGLTSNLIVPGQLLVIP